VKGDKVVAFCDRHCNVIAPFVAAPGNRNESPLPREALPEVMRISREVGMNLVWGFSCQAVFLASSLNQSRP